MAQRDARTCEPLGRCIAPDLIGMGDSDKLPDSGPDSYTFVEHRRYLDALLEALDVRERRHARRPRLGFGPRLRLGQSPSRCGRRDRLHGGDRAPAALGGVAAAARSIFEGLRSAAGEEMVLEKNLFVEAVLPAVIIRTLTDEEMAEYRRPFAEPGEGRRPTLTWPRQIPIDGEPADVRAIVAEYADWLATSDVPKLFVKAEPGAILANDTLVNLVRGWPALTEKTVAGIDFVQGVRRTRLGEPSPAGWGRWGDRAMRRDARLWRHTQKPS